jgi:anhydro-N-acetylmuramic acid kinase
VVNIGGIANVTNLPPGSPGVGVTGWDTGPGNVLLDAWCERHRHVPFDRDGAWAASGVVRDELLQHFLADPYFTRNPPKSTGRDLFNTGWLDALQQGSERPEDVQATLLRLTVETIARDVIHHCAGASQILICGGGARNSALLRGLAAALLAGKQTNGDSAPLVLTTDDCGVPANQVEALAFAWLARRILRGEPGNLPAVTGARGERVLGAIYPA